MADSVTTVNVTPNTTITLPSPDNSGSQAIAAALLKSSENQAISTASLISAMTPQPQAVMPDTSKQQSADKLNLGLLAIIGLLLWK